MPKFKVVVQIYKEFEFEAVDAEHAKEQAQNVLDKIKIKDRYNICEPKNLDKEKEKEEKKNGKNG